MRDDLGTDVELARAPRRVVSLVPSLTEALAVTVPDRLVGATDWCTHPADHDDRGVARVRGTKNPDLAAVAALEPDTESSYFANRLIDSLASTARVMSVPSLVFEEADH